jgi:Ser/Thr protein kinase RdoA (MazF antagonist)
MSVADDVLAHYPAPLHGQAQPLGNHGGFSNACLFRVHCSTGILCLRRWPLEVGESRVADIHALMHRAAGLDFVPRILRTTAGASFIRHSDSVWELATWMPGTASFRDSPSAERLRAACAALASIHRAWAHPSTVRLPCPAVQRRLDAVKAWQPRIDAGWQPPVDTRDPVAPWAQRAWPIVRRRLPQLPNLLLPWRSRPVRAQPCLCDVWHDHVLFTGDRVTGLVDFGSYKLDHVSVDLARLLGSMVGDDDTLWTLGLDAFAEHRPLTGEERALARDLDRSGVVVAAANWLRRLYRDGRTYSDRQAVAGRLAALVTRLEASGG